VPSKPATKLRPFPVCLRPPFMCILHVIVAPTCLPAFATFMTDDAIQPNAAFVRRQLHPVQSNTINCTNSCSASINLFRYMSPQFMFTSLPHQHRSTDMHANKPLTVCLLPCCNIFVLFQKASTKNQLMSANHLRFKRCPADFLQYFIQSLRDMGPAGYVAYAVVYAGLELLALPGACSGACWGMMITKY
jgi:hypothetical protein